MTSDDNITVDSFTEAFDQEWCERIRDEAACDRIARAYQCDGTWTDFMLGKKGQRDGFLDSVGKRLNRYVGKEWYYLDCVLYQGASQLIGYGVYPAGCDVIIEHENNNDVEQEMWKQLMWRSPLKVLIFYDWPEYKREEDPDKGRWLDRKICELRTMAEQTRCWWPENEATEYLLVVGCIPSGGDLPRWRHLPLF